MTDDDEFKLVLDSSPLTWIFCHCSWESGFHCSLYNDEVMKHKMTKPGCLQFNFIFFTAKCKTFLMKHNSMKRRNSIVNWQIKRVKLWELIFQNSQSYMKGLINNNKEKSGLSAVITFASHLSALKRDSHIVDGQHLLIYRILSIDRIHIVWDWWDWWGWIYFYQFTIRLMDFNIKNNICTCLGINKQWEWWSRRQCRWRLSSRAPGQ